MTDPGIAHAPNERMKERRLLLQLTSLAFLVRLAAWLFFALNLPALITARMPDDALYYFTTARNLASGFGISIDRVHPTNGMHPLWLLAITPLFALGLSKWAAIHAVFLVQSVLDGCVVWLIGDTLCRILPKSMDADNRISAMGVATLMYALSPTVVLHAINGLETTFAALFLVLWLRSATGLAEAPDDLRHWLWCGFVTGLLLLARTDTIVIILPASLWLGMRPLRPHLTFARVATALAVAIALVAPWLLWNLHSFGTIVQSSAEAVPLFAMKKYDIMYGATGKYLHLLYETLRTLPKPFFYTTYGLSIVTIVAAVVTRRRHIAPGFAVLLMMLVGSLALLAFHAFFRGFIRDWYVYQALPLYLIAFGLSIAWNAQGTVRASGRWTLATLILLLQFVLVNPIKYESQARVVSVGVPTTDSLSRIGRVASLNSGYYSYFAARPERIVNLDGVVNHDALLAIRHGAIGEYLHSDSVRYLYDFAGDLRGYRGLIDPHMLDAFHPIRRSVDSAAPDEMVLYVRN